VTLISVSIIGFDADKFPGTSVAQASACGCYLQNE
jgi:hypothetical protein